MITTIGLSKLSVFYSLRHSLITELAHEGIDLLTIAQISGTSYKMIEKHYGHLTEKQSRLALSKISL
jgi:site-specific recombinase XerD